MHQTQYLVNVQVSRAASASALVQRLVTSTGANSTTPTLNQSNFKRLTGRRNLNWCARRLSTHIESESEFYWNYMDLCHLRIWGAGWKASRRGGYTRWKEYKRKNTMIVGIAMRCRYPNILAIIASQKTCCKELRWVWGHWSIGRWA